MSSGRPAPDHRKAARDYLLGRKKQFSALAEAGYSPKQARKGFNATLKSSRPLRQAVKNQLHEWEKIAEILPLPNVRANLVRVRLVMNLLTGKDAAVQSAKLLGLDHEVNLFEPEVRVGIRVNASPPAEWQNRYIQSAPTKEESA